MVTRKSTEQQGTLPKETQDNLRREVLKLTHNTEEQKRKRDRRDKIFYSCFAGFVLLITLLGIATGNWLGVIFNISTLIWILALWSKDKYISLLRQIVDTTLGLRELEMQEAIKLEKIMKGEK